MIDPCRDCTRAAAETVSIAAVTLQHQLNKQLSDKQQILIVCETEIVCQFSSPRQTQTVDQANNDFTEIG
jgi:hypothetical protein